MNNTENRWFTSDLHLGHEGIIEFCERPYKNTADMDDALITHINAVVSEHDQVYHLGDFTMEANYDIVRKYFEALKGRWHFYVGNHDDEAHLNRLALDYPGRVLSVRRLHRIKVKDQGIVMCHYPLATWDKIYHGTWHLFGHLHGNYEHPSMAAMDVGIDTNNMELYSFKDIAMILTRTFVVDHRMVR